MLNCHLFLNAILLCTCALEKFKNQRRKIVPNFIHSYIKFEFETLNLEHNLVNEPVIFQISFEK